MHSLVRLVADAVHEECDPTGGSTSEQAAGADALTTDIAERVRLQAEAWPSTHTHFQRAGGLHAEWTTMTTDEMREEFNTKMKLDSERTIHELQHLLDPIAHPASSTDGASYTSATPVRPARPHSSHQSYHSLFSPLPSYESLDARCAMLVDPSSSIASRRTALDSVLDMSASDLLACPQWESLLPAVLACLAPREEKSDRRRDRDRDTDKRAARAAGATAAEAQQTFMLAARATTALADLYESAESSPQAAEVVLGVIAALKARLPSVAAASPTAGVQWLAALPANAPLESPGSSPPSRPSPSLAACSIFAHLSRLLTHGLHALSESWIYFDVDLVARLHHETASLFTLALQQRTSHAWVLLTMSDTRLTWLRRWTAQVTGRLGWHGASMRRGSRALEEAWKMVREGFGAFVANVTSTTTTTTTDDATLIVLPPVATAALACTSAWAFLTEHLSSLVDRPTPDVLSSSSSSHTRSPSKVPGGSSSSHHQSQSHKLRGASQKKRVDASTAASPTPTSATKHAKQDLKELEEYACGQHQVQMRSTCIDFAAHALAHLALANTNTTETHAIVTRARLTFVALTQRFLDQTLPSTSATIALEASPTGDVETPDVPRLLAHLLASIESVREPTGSIASAVIANNLLFVSSSTGSGVSSAVSPPRTINKSRSQQDVHYMSHTSSSHKKNHVHADARRDERRAAMAASASETTTTTTTTATMNTDAAAAAPQSISVVQHAAITAILGTCLSLMRGSPQCRILLTHSLLLPGSSTPHHLLSLLCRWLNLEDAPSHVRRFEFVADAQQQPAPISEQDAVIYLPTVVERIMVDLIREATTSESALHAEDAPLVVDHVAHLRQLADRIEQQIRSLPKQDAELESSAPVVPAAAVDEMPSVPHQQSEEVAMWLDLWLHWCTHTESLDALHESHPALLAHACAQFCMLLRTHTSHSPCLPWCRRCAHPAATPARVPHLHLAALHRLLRRLLHSQAALESLVRAGLVHALFDSLAHRMREEDGTWTLPFELEEEDREPHEHLWSLRMLVSVLSSRWCLHLLEGEVSLLTSASSVSARDFLSAPHPPLFLLLSHGIDTWLLQTNGFIDDDAATSTHAVATLPMSVPIDFPLPSTATSSALPASWWNPLRPYPVASLSDAQEIAFILLDGLLSSSSPIAASDALRRWWSLPARLEDATSDDQPEDQCTRWRQRVHAKLTAQA